MVIKTITCQKVDNHGACLQAYALMHYLEEIGHKVEIIDYIPDWFKHFRPLYCGTPKYATHLITKIMYIIVKFPGRVMDYFKYLKSPRKANFDSFRNKYFHLTKTYDSYEQLKANPPRADLYFAGSDQIWNTMMDNGKDPAYYLQFVTDDNIKASYAASFSVSEIPNELKENTKKYLSSFDYISVREKTALSILADLDINDAQVVLDPVFLLGKNDFESLESDVSFDENYILVYDFEGAGVVKNFALEYAKKHNVRIYSLYSNNYCDKNFEAYGPDVFLSLIKNAKFIISNSFHATAFSLIYNKEFAVVKREEGINSRMTDLLASVGLEERIVTKYCELEKIDYSSVNKKIDESITISKAYIKKVLESVECK